MKLLQMDHSCKVLFKSKQAKQPSLLRAGSAYLSPTKCIHLGRMCMHVSAWGRGEEKHLLKEKLVSAERECLAWATQVDKARSFGGATFRTST